MNAGLSAFDSAATVSIFSSVVGAVVVTVFVVLNHGPVELRSNDVWGSVPRITAVKEVRMPCQYKALRFHLLLQIPLHESSYFATTGA